MLAGKRRWSVILAGGDGLRLRPVTRLICGDDRPKQFCRLLSEQTLLEVTRRRVRKCQVSEDQILVSLTSGHRDFYRLESGFAPSQRVVQPLNRGTAPPIVHSLMSIAAIDAEAIVAILPSDHHFTNEPVFEDALERAFVMASEHPQAVILMGAQAGYPELEYGWIEPANQRPVDSESPLFAVRAFHEKPTFEVAQMLFRKGCLWNTFVMIGHVGAFLRMVRRALPDLLAGLSRVRLWTGRETEIDEASYRALRSSSFSLDVLSAGVKDLQVMRLDGAGWTDLGNPARAANVAMSSIVHQPDWTRHWLPQPMSRALPHQV
jgi:mannose-1-phosphate guanylyltransferase